MPYTITVEPLRSTLRILTGHEATPDHLAVVEREGPGRVVQVLATTDCITDAYVFARHYARRLGAELVTRTAYGHTVIGVQAAIAVAQDPDCQPMVAA